MTRGRLTLHPSYSRKDLALVTFGHHFAKGDLETPQVGLHNFIPTNRDSQSIIGLYQNSLDAFFMRAGMG